MASSDSASPSATSPTATPSQVEVVPGGPVVGSIRPPGSKSLTNRALICAAFAGAPSQLTGALRSEDTEVMIAALDQAGVSIEVRDGGRTLHVDPSDRKPLSSESELIELFIGNSGTSVRFLTAALSAAGGHFRLHGVPRMHQRPIADLIGAIAPVLDGTIEAQSPEGCPPVLVASNGWNAAKIEVGGAVSSQYLSGLMMAAPLSRAGAETEIAVIGELVSRPYVTMTANVMRSFGADVSISDFDASATFKIASAGYKGIDYAIEPDASAASYFWATAAITGGKITVEGLSKQAMQGDVGFCEVLSKMGCEVDYQDDSVTVTGNKLRGVDIDMNAISDTVQTLSIVALFADGPTRVRGVAHNRFKETDRIGDLAVELRKLGAKVDEHEDGMTIHPPVDGIQPATLETYHDHRMAMSFALTGLRASGVKILDPSCTAKTYPEFFADLEKLIGRAHLWA